MAVAVLNGASGILNVGIGLGVLLVFILFWQGLAGWVEEHIEPLLVRLLHRERHEEEEERQNLMDELKGDSQGYTPGRMRGDFLKNRKDKRRNWDASQVQAVASQMFYRVITSQTDYEECRSFRTHLAGGLIGDWAGSATAQASALDQMKVNSQDIFAYFTLQFQSARQVLDNTILSQLELCDDALQAAKAGTFREKYGDMVVVGHITGGEAEAALRVSKFTNSKRNEIKLALEASFKDPQSGSAASGSAEEERSTSRALQDCSCTVFTNRRGVTDHTQKVNPTEWSRLLKVLELGAKNDGEKIAAVCYKMDLFPQVPKDLLGFQTMMVEQNVKILQRQFAQLAFVKNSCEALLDAASNKEMVLPNNIKKRVEDLRAEAMSAETLFLRYTSSHQVEKLQGGDPASYMGERLMEEWKKIGQSVDSLKNVSDLSHKLQDYKATRLAAPVAAAPMEAPPPSVALNPDDTVVLLLRLGGARNLPEAALGLSEFYVNVFVQGQKLRSPTVKRATSQCDWGYEFPPIELRSPWENLSIEVQLKSEAMLMRNSTVGVITIPMSKVPRGPDEAARTGPGNQAADNWQQHWKQNELPNGGGLSTNALMGGMNAAMTKVGGANTDRSQLRTFALAKPDGSAGMRGELAMLLRLDPMPKY